MLCENIKHFRKAKGISQEEMAVKLHVVRQTVSKWENGLSVPDADVLVHMAELLDVSVSRLLGIEAGSNENSNLSEELQKLNEELAKINRQEKLARQAGEKTGLIIFLSIAAMLLALTVKNEIASIALVGVCLLTAKISLQRHNHKSQQKPSQPTLKRRFFQGKGGVFFMARFWKGVVLT